jgi:ABC-2 type transport system permease protein
VRPDLSAYWQLTRAGFRKQANYRLAMLAGLTTNVVFGFIRAAILFAAVAAAGGELSGYDQDGISAYVWLSQGLLGAVELGFAPSEIGDRIKNGDIAIDFTRPVDVQATYLAADLGRAAYTFIPRGLPSVLVGALTVGLTMPGTALPYLLGVVSIVLAVTVSFLCRYAVNVLGFWLVETRGVRSLYGVTATFLAGLYVPVHIFPGWLSALAHATPFPSILQSPIDVLSGRVAGWDSVQLLVIQAFWVLVIGALGRVLTTAGRRKLEVQGG